MQTLIWRFCSIAGATLFAQYFVVLQQTELFYKNRIMKLQQKQLVNVFNNQPDGIVLTRARPILKIVENGANVRQVSTISTILISWLIWIFDYRSIISIDNFIFTFKQIYFWHIYINI